MKMVRVFATTNICMMLVVFVAELGSCLWERDSERKEYEDAKKRKLGQI